MWEVMNERAAWHAVNRQPISDERRLNVQPISDERPSAITCASIQATVVPMRWPMERLACGLAKILHLKNNLQNRNGKANIR